MPAAAPALNRLAHATSPYLLQHAHNPVDWYEWGPEALERARREDRPLFLSIGYSACHWCHVMAHESFEDPAVAAVMNRLFVNIKVDREERPDLDELYMQAALLLNHGQGGWPLSAWLTPDGRPFFAGTYFPPRARWGRPGFVELCERIGELWRSRREALTGEAQNLAEYLARGLRPSAAPDAKLTLADLDRTVQLLAGAFDAQRGGIASGGTNKFPPSMALDLFLRFAHRHGPAAADSQHAQRLVEVTLDHMAAGGIYDQLAGGIHRYSTDLEWHVPHFEKMLYDQALVSRVYTDAWQALHRPLYRRIAAEICDYVLADLRAPEGGFYSARDADSEGEEGRYYVWTRAEILAELGADDGELFCAYYDVRPGGNWADPHAPGVAKNVLRVPRDLDTMARLHRLALAELEQRLAAGRDRLLAARRRRVAPARDEKVLVEWNGLMIASLARAGSVLGESKYVEAARQAAEFILAHQCRDGRLLRTWRAGRTSSVAFLTDYAALIDGLLELYDATFEPRWVESAATLNEFVLAHFLDAAGGGFFLTADDHEPLLVRSNDVRDGAVPSGNSAQLGNLLKLATLLGDPRLRGVAEQCLRHLGGDVLAQPGSGERFLAAAELSLVGPVEIAIVGDPQDPATRALLAEVYATYLPNRVLALAHPGAHPGDPGLENAAPLLAGDISSPLPTLDGRPGCQGRAGNISSPLLAGRAALHGRPTAYVCRNQSCLPPVQTPADLAAQLAG